MDIKNQKGRATISLNGKVYDARTGRVLDAVTHKAAPKTRHYGSFDVRPAAGVHAGPERSQTLRRTGLAKPQPAKTLVAGRKDILQANRHDRIVTRTIAPVATHPSVSRFGRPVEAQSDSAHVVRPSDVLSSLSASDPYGRPAALAAQVQNYSPASTVSRPALKAAKPKSHAVTEKQLAHAPGRAQKASAARSRAKVDSAWKKIRRRVRLSPPIIVIGIIIAAIVASAICYLTVPALSLFVAAKSAHVEATYPNYIPAGYHFSGPVDYSNGSVTMTFKSSGSDKAFTITQKNTPWDSGAVLDNYVLVQSSDYLTYSQGGMTIYTFGSDAAWVNAQVLHTVGGDADLTSDQILRIAGSM